MLTVSDRIQIPFKTTRKDTRTQVNTSYYLLVNTASIHLIILLANTAFGRLRAVPLRSVTSKLGRTGESEFTRARKAPLSVNSLSPVLPSLDVTDRRGTARSLSVRVLCTQSVFLNDTQSVVSAPQFMPSPCFTPGFTSNPQSSFYTDQIK